MTEEEKPITDLKLNEFDIFREYLIGLRNHYGPYHESKERIAWAAITIYMTGVIAITISIVSNYKILPIGMWGKLAFSSLLIFTAVLISIFIWNEFKNRQVAVEIVRSVGELLAKLTNPDFTIDFEDMKHENYRNPINGERYVFPKIFCDHLNTEEEQIRVWKPSRDLFLIMISIWTLSMLFLIWAPSICNCP